LDWTDEEVVRRWLAAFPGALRNAKTAEQEEGAVLSQISTPALRITARMCLTASSLTAAKPDSIDQKVCGAPEFV